MFTPPCWRWELSEPLAVGLVLALRQQVAQAWNVGSGRTLVAPPSFTLPDGAAAVVLVFAALAAVMVIARKLGPAAVSGPEGYWWLGLPLDRWPMVAGRLARRLAAVWAGASVLHLPIGFITDLEAWVSGQVLAAGTFGAAAVCAALLAALRQAGPDPEAPGPSRPELLQRLFSGPFPALLLLAALSFVPRQAAAGVLGPALAALAADVALGLLVFVRLGRIPAGS